MWSLVVVCARPTILPPEKAIVWLPFFSRTAGRRGAAGAQALCGPNVEVDGGAQTHQPLGTFRRSCLWQITQACLDFSQGRGGDQFLKDSAQDLKNRRNINKVGLLPNPFPLPRDYYIEPTLVPGSVCCSAASQRWAPWSWAVLNISFDNIS